MSHTIIQCLLHSIQKEKYIIFPTNEAYAFWSHRLSKHVEVLSLERCFTCFSFSHLLLSKYLAGLGKEKCKYIHIVSQRERHILFAMLLKHKDVQQMLAKVEQIEVLGQGISIDDFSQNYVYKLESLLQAFYLIIRTSKKNTFFIHVLQTCFERYMQMLSDTACIDSLVLPTLLQQNSIYIDSQCVLVTPGLLSQEQEAIFLYLHQNNILMIDCIFDPIVDTQPVDEQNALTINMLEYMQYMEHTAMPSYSQKEIKKFSHTRQELDYVCQKIQKDLENTNAHDISITVCTSDAILLEDLHSIALNYGIPLQELSHVHTFPLLDPLWQIYSKGYSLQVLKQLLLDPHIMWKERAFHIRIVQLTHEKVPIDDSNITFWKEVLKQEVSRENYASNMAHLQELQGTYKGISSQASQSRIWESIQGEYSTLTLFEYFMHFHQLLCKAIESSCFVELKSNVRTFVETFIDISPPDDDVQFLWLEQLYMLLDDYDIFSVHVKKYTTHFEKELSPFQILKTSLQQFSVAKSTNYLHSTVHVHTFSNALHLPYKHHYFVGFSQNNLKRSLSRPQFFHEILSSQYISETLQDSYNMRNNYLQYSLEYSGEKNSISFSEHAHDGIQIDPIFWNNVSSVLVEEKPQRERVYWQQFAQARDNNSIDMSDYTLSHAQNKGLKYQKSIQDGGHSPSLFCTAIDWQIREKYQQYIKKGNNTAILHSSISPSSLLSLLEDPQSYLLGNVFRLQELFLANDFVYSERALFSSLIHAVFAHMANRFAEYMQEYDASGLIVSEEILQKLLEIIPDVVSLGKDIFFKKLATEPLYSFMRQSIEQAFHEQLLYRFANTILKYMYASQCRINIIEQKLEYSFSALQSSQNEFPPFVLQGKPDLCFYHAKESYYSLFDYKLCQDNIQRLQGHFLQLWSYHLLVSKSPDFFLFTPDTKQEKGAKTKSDESHHDAISGVFKGHLYHIASSKAQSSLYTEFFLVPMILLSEKLEKHTLASNTIKKAIHKKETKKGLAIYAFLAEIENTLCKSLRAVYELDFPSFYVQGDSQSLGDVTDEEDDRNSGSEHEAKGTQARARASSNNFIHSLILREACMIQRNRNI